jgi:colicin import membrane protein
MRPTRKGEKPGPGPGGIWKPGFLSLVIHLLLLAAVSLGMNGIGKGLRPDVVRVSIIPGGGGSAGPPAGPAGGPPPQAPPAPAVKEAGPEKSPAPEAPKARPYEGERETGRIKRKPPTEKAERAVRERPKEMPKEIPEGLRPPRKPTDETKRIRDEEAKRALQAALDDITRKTALERYEKSVKEKERTRRPEAPPVQEPARERPPVGPVVPSSTTPPTGPGTSGWGSPGSRGTGPGGPGRGGPGGPDRGGPGSGEGGPGGPGFGPGGGTKLDEYGSLVWARIQEEWTLPESLSKARGQLEATVVLVLSRDGRVQKAWIEKPSGYALYDQAVMRAVKKAEPFPSFPREILEDTLEIGFRFRPD